MWRTENTKTFANMDCRKFLRHVARKEKNYIKFSIEKMKLRNVSKKDEIILGAVNKLGSKISP